MEHLTNTAGLRRAFALLAAWLLVLFAVPSQGSITVTKTNNSGTSVDGSSVDQAVNFSAADFAGATLIGKVAVTISFAKLSVAANRRPGFREVGFTLSSSGGSAILIQGGNGNSFRGGAKGTSFDGTITFDQDALQVVNVDRALIQPGTFQPHTGDLGSFVGTDAPGIWTLNISDSRGTGRNNTPLTVTSWSVSITTVPEPDSIGLWAMTGLLAAMIVFHRPRRRAAGMPPLI